MGDDMPEAGPGGEIAVYESTEGEIRVDVRLERETVWLTQRQMAQVFDTTPENVLMHLRNIFASGELEADATTKEFLVVRTEGRRRVRRSLKHYNLDAIVLVGYRSAPPTAQLVRETVTALTFKPHQSPGQVRSNQPHGTG